VDLGCGTGDWCDAVARYFSEIMAVLGVDISLPVVSVPWPKCGFYLCKFPDDLDERFDDAAFDLVQLRYVID